MRKLLQKIINLSALILLTFFLSGSALILLNILAPNSYKQIRNNIIISPICNAVEMITEKTNTALTAFSNTDTEVVYINSIKDVQKTEEQDETEKQVLAETVENPEEYWTEEIALLKQHMVNSGYDFLTTVFYHGSGKKTPAERS